MTSETCIQCQSPAIKRCTGCVGAPSYDEYVSKSTFYCGPVCQKADWRRHKSECRKLQARNFLRRAAFILQAIIYRIRLHASPLRFKSARTEGSIIYLEEFQINGPYTQLRPLPVCLDDDREAVSVYMGCLEAMACLCCFAKELLGGLCSKIEEINVNLINQKRRICPILQSGAQIDLPEPLPHNLYRVTLKNREIWAIDTTGAQYGCAEPLCPWRDFEQQRVSKINRECEFGYMWHLFYQPTVFAVAQLEQQELAKLLENKIPVWAREYGGNFNAILRGSDSVFKAAANKFLGQFEYDLGISITELHTPEKIERRAEKVKSEMSLNVADPRRRQELERLIRYMASVMGASAISSILPEPSKLFR